VRTFVQVFVVTVLLGLVMVFFAARADAHRLSGHPKSIQGKLTLAKRQLAHDHRSLEARSSQGWTLLSPIVAFSHRWWLARDRAYVKQLERLSNPRLYVDSCLRRLIDRENPSWDPQRYNAQGSGAYGLPQALPGSKMASAGADWRTNPQTQIRWMVGYVNERYGGSCAALAHSYAYGWY
jgi:hypothetical protein